MREALAKLLERWSQWEDQQRADDDTDIALAMLRARWTFNPKESQ